MEKYNCNKCDQEDNERMVQCDGCDRWYHFDCVSVDSNVANESWNCTHCEDSTPTSNAPPNLAKRNAQQTAVIDAALKPMASSSPTAKQGLTQPPISLLSSQNKANVRIQPQEISSDEAVMKVTAKGKLTEGPSSLEKLLENIKTITTLNNGAKSNPTTTNVSSVTTPVDRIAAVTAPSTINANHENEFCSANEKSDNNALLPRHLQLQRLDEEMKLQQQYIENKYRILSQTGETDSHAGVFSSIPTTAQLAARQVIPKNLPTFSGDPDEWPLFISSYENSTAVAGFTDAENLMRLQACLKGKARETVKYKLYLPSMVPEIIQTLRMYFGRPEHILERAIVKARNTPPIKDKLESLIDFALCVRNICATIESCHMEEYLKSPFLVKELVDKLPSSHKLSWAMQPKNSQVPTVKMFSDWLYGIAEAASTVVSLAPNKAAASINTHTEVKNEQNSSCDPDRPQRYKCVICKAPDHKVAQCETFKSATVSQRWDYVKKERICRQCLGTHRNKCSTTKPCGIDNCIFKHHQLLHKSKSENTSEQKHLVSNSETLRKAQVNAHCRIKDEGQPYFRLVPVNIHSKDNITKTFAFLDEGSSVTLIEKSVFNDLNLDGDEDPLCLRWTGNTTKLERDSVRTTITVSNVFNGRSYKLSDVRTVQNLNLPEQSLNADELISRYRYLMGLPLQSYRDAKPTILIGANNWKLAVPLKIREGKWNQPIATKTRLGWTLQGCVNPNVNESYLNMHTCECQELQNMMKEYFEMEKSKPQQLLSEDDKTAIQILKETCNRVDGRYEVGLMWRNSDVELPESYTNALNRLVCMQKKFDKDATLKSKIQTQIELLVSKGYAIKLSPEMAARRNRKTWYLPIFIVSNPNKPSKVRLVWDAAARSNGTSLNDFLLSGPDLLNSLVDVLLTFRIGKIAVCADIEEMFHRIVVRKEDMHSQRFLWADIHDDIHKPSVYVMRALTFGLNCAPCIAHFVRNENAEKFKSKFPRAVEAIQNYHYVDDFIDSDDDETTVIKLANQVKQIHAVAGFSIRNWSSNSTKVLENLRDKAAHEVKLKEWGSNTKVLGMYWDSDNDVFKYVCRFARLRRDIINEALVPTKREILQALMSIFDPLGFVSCYTIGLKILLQEVWRSGIGWDDPLNSVLYSKWCKWKFIMSQITDTEIQRCYSTSLKHSESVQLHTFVDAGQNAFAAVCYLRILSQGDIIVTIVAAKCKVAPLKPISIPRLELQAAVVGVRLARKILNVRRIGITEQFWWTDSKTVLKWIRMDPKGLQQYVMHRVGEIVEHTNISQWRWVPSKENPSDLATKVAAHTNSEKWLKGPEFLKRPADHWPECPEFEDTKYENPEFKRCLVVAKEDVFNKLNIERFSNWRRLYRAIATFLLFIKKLKARITSTVSPTEISFEMIHTSRRYLLRYAQSEAYEATYNRLKSGKPLLKDSNLIALNVYLDDYNIIRSKGRAEVLNNHEDPIILPQNHHVTFLLVRWIHERFHHRMHEAVINRIRSEYHIPKLRVLYKKVRRMCQYCKNEAASPNMPQMAPLPTARLAAFERPFTYVGIDYFGPIYVTVGRRREKRWGVLYTCLTIRAIHIEIAYSMDTSSCIMSIKNFIARRGQPREIYSDNGTNFKAAEKVLREEIRNIDKTVIQSKFDEILWKFNPPGAPHMGGAWERLIRTIKTTLYSICPSIKFTDESLRNALCEVESIINSRPLTFVSVDSDDDEAITPNHLLLGSSDGYKPTSNENLDLRQRWHHTQRFANQFWHRWLKEYVPIIARRSKWFTKQAPIEVGAVVIIADYDLPRNCWPKGIVTDTVTAKDGQVRRVTVKTRSGTFQRPATKIAVLDVGNSESKIASSDSFTGAGVLPPALTTAEQ